MDLIIDIALIVLLIAILIKLQEICRYTRLTILTLARLNPAQAPNQRPRARRNLDLQF